MVEPTPGGGTTVRFRVPARPGRPEGLGHRHRRAPALDGAVVGARLVRDQDGTLRLTGELDLASAEALGPELLAAVDSAMPGRLDLDLSAVSYLASAGIGLLLEGLRRARAAGGRLHVHADGNGPAARVLELAGVDTALGARPRAGAGGGRLPDRARAGLTAQLATGAGRRRSASSISASWLRMCSGVSSPMTFCSSGVWS